MATIKSYTDLQQSKKLAEILPLESADMIYIPIMDIDSMSNAGFLDTPECYPFDEYSKNSSIKPLPCWSLAALLNILPNYHITNNGITGVVVWSMDIYSKEHPNLIDACVEMILKLHKCCDYVEV